jgi:Cytochrome c554 and c-prime/Doubled CXXCH motif (Paired_CXXCH_1)
MFVRRLRWGGVAFGLGLMVGSGLIGFSDRAFAQVSSVTYVGDQFCGACHSKEYSRYFNHGHRWMEVHVGGQQPTTNPYQAIGVALPTTLPTGVTWSQVQDIVGNFKEENGSAAAFLLTNGNLVESNGAVVKPMPARCNKCHNTGVDPTGHAYGQAGIQGSWALPGVQCEQCHGAGPSMQIPNLGVCRDCHSSGDSQYRIPIAATINSSNQITAISSQLLNNHHPQGDEYRRSPHKDKGCTLCHDPHKSTWHEQGGVLYTEGVGTGAMCTKCHAERIRGTMGQVGLVCADCHMPRVSAGGTRAAHLFRINPGPVSMMDNVVVQANDSGKAGAFWANSDGSTSSNGNSFLTLDLVCTQCHGNMDIQRMSNAAQFIHRAFGMIDLTVNGSESVTTVKSTKPVVVNFAVVPGSKAGLKANWYVLYHGPKGWMSWNGKKWVAGQIPWRKNSALTTLPSTNVMASKLPVGKYTFWVNINPTDGSHNVGSVSLSVVR